MTPTTVRIKNLATARAFGEKAADNAPIGTEATDFSACVSEAARTVGANKRRADEAGGAAFYRLRQRQADAHVAGTWCPCPGGRCVLRPEPEPERTPCSVQDTTAAALIPGDVVLGPSGWVIVARVETLTADLAVRIHPPGKAAPFDRAYDATVPAQIGADTMSSASCQHFIETGRYLRRVDALTPALMVVCPSCGWAHRDPTNARCDRCRRA
jgi:hypothetical protein